MYRVNIHKKTSTIIVCLHQSLAVLFLYIHLSVRSTIFAQFPLVVFLRLVIQNLQHITQFRSQKGSIKNSIRCQPIDCMTDSLTNYVNPSFLFPSSRGISHLF